MRIWVERSVFRAAIFGGAAVFALAHCTAAAPEEEVQGNIPDPDPTVEPYMLAASDSGQLKFEVRTTPDQPPSRGTSIVALTALDGSGASLEGLDLKAVPWMPAMGHGSSVKPEIEVQSDGVYLIRRVNMYMGGAWDLRISIAGSATDHATLHFSIP